MKTFKRFLLSFSFVLMLACLPSLSVQAQDCDCETEVEFLVDRFLKDYSGIQDFKIAHPDYEAQFQLFIDKAKVCDDVLSCHALIGEFIAYLDNGHVVFGVLESNPKFEVLYEEDDRDYYPSLVFPDSKTAILSIKTGSIDYKIDLDTLIDGHADKLAVTEHLIIDLRGNSGGGDDTYTNVIPFIYTQPIITHGTFLWASDNNVSLFEAYVDSPSLPEETRRFIQDLVAKGRENPNSFVLFGESETDTLVLDEVKDFPKKVSILIDGKCTSATEEFLLKAKQSSKTTLYGRESTGGALDYSNLNAVVTPSGFWYVTVPTTRSSRLPENPVDPDGIAPDVLVGEDVENMIVFVMKEFGGVEE